MGFVSDTATSFTDNTTPVALNVTVASADVLALIGYCVNTADRLQTPTSSGHTWTLRAQIDNIASRGNIGIWTTTAQITGTLGISMDCLPSPPPWGYTVYRYNNISAIGNAISGNGASGTQPSLNLTTTVADAIIVFGCIDADESVAARTYRTTAGTFTEETFHSASLAGSKIGGYYPDVDTGGSKNVGMTAPTQRWSAVALELRPVTGPVATSTVLTVDPASPTPFNTTEELTATVTPSAAGTVQFKDSGTNLGAPAAVNNGVAVAEVILMSGMHSLIAVFTPTDPLAFDPSTSNTVPYVVNSAPPAPWASSGGTWRKIKRRMMYIPR